MPTTRNKSNFLITLLLAGWTAYGMTITLMLILKFTIGERPLLRGFGSPVGVFNSVLQVALFPALPGIVILLLLRRPRLAAWQIPAFALFLVMYGGNFVPHLPVVAASDDTPRLSLLTYNLLYSNPYHEDSAALIALANADVVTLQEVTDEAADVIARSLDADYPYHVIGSTGGGASGMAIFSRYPLLEDQTWQDGHNQQQVVVQIDDRTVTLFNVHPPIPLGFGANPAYRTATLHRVLDRAKEIPGRVILAGDFNMGDGSDDYRDITRSYTDSFKVAGYGFGLSYPDWSRGSGLARFMPVLARLDYVFYSAGLQATTAWTSQLAGGSDHRPYYVELLLTGD